MKDVYTLQVPGNEVLSAIFGPKWYKESGKRRL
jgi:hypothetical protein